MKKRITAVLMALAMAASLAACGGEKQGTKTKEGGDESDAPESITIICTTDDEELFQYVGNQYKEEYGVDVKLISQAYDSTHEKITTTWTGGGDADICYVDVVWAAEFGNLGLTVPLDEYMNDEYRDSLIDSALSQMVYDGKTQAIPFANNGKWMFYNTAMLEEAGITETPKTWDELKTVSQTLIDKGICKYGIAWGGSQAEGLICDLTTMIYGFGGQWQNEDGSFAFNSDASEKALQFMYDSMKDGWADPASITYTDRDCLDPFLAGDTAFVMNWSYVYDYANNPENSSVAGNVDICLMPGTDAAPSASVTGGGGLGVMSTSKHPDYAFKFIEMLTGSEIEKYAFETYNTLPTVDTLYQDADLLEENEALGKFYPQFETAHFRPQLTNYSEWSNTVQPFFSAALSGETSVKDALKQADEASQEFVEK